MLSSNRKTRSKGRLVRSLEFEDIHTTALSTTANTTTAPSKSTRSCNKKRSSPVKSIWRKNVIDPVGFTTHKMSSITNNFLSSDVHVSSSSSSSVEDMVGDLVDPGRGTLVFAQHDEVFRTSPLSSSSSFIIEDQDQSYEDETVSIFETETSCNFSNFPDDDGQQDSLGMTWNPKQNQWLPLIYRYVFPSSAFSIPKKHQQKQQQNVQNVSWSLKNGQFITPTATFTFPPAQKSIMMGRHCDDKDARDVCEKLLELMEDENLMLPVVKVPSQCSSPIEASLNAQPGNTTSLASSAAVAPPQVIPLKSLLSEWSSLPSSPPPPIFHDVLCNRPIPELRLSPPMSGKSVIGKRPNPNPTCTTVNSPCESPLTKRLRFSSSSSSIA